MVYLLWRIPRTPLSYKRYYREYNRQNEFTAPFFNMKLILSVLSLAFLATSAFAQGAVIGYPPQGLSVSSGSNLTVQVERPVSF